MLHPNNCCLNEGRYIWLMWLVRFTLHQTIRWIFFENPKLCKSFFASLYDAWIPEKEQNTFFFILNSIGIYFIALIHKRQALPYGYCFFNNKKFDFARFVHFSLFLHIATISYCGESFRWLLLRGKSCICFFIFYYKYKASHKNDTKRKTNLKN